MARTGEHPWLRFGWTGLAIAYVITEGYGRVHDTIFSCCNYKPALGAKCGGIWDIALNNNLKRARGGIRVMLYSSGITI